MPCLQAACARVEQIAEAVAQQVKAGHHQLLRTYGTEPLDCAVTLGVAERVPCRLLAVPVAQTVCDQRRRCLQREARRKGRTASADQVALCGWTLIAA